MSVGTIMFVDHRMCLGFSGCLCPLSERSCLSECATQRNCIRTCNTSANTASPCSRTINLHTHRKCTNPCEDVCESIDNPNPNANLDQLSEILLENSLRSFFHPPFLEVGTSKGSVETLLSGTIQTSVHVKMQQSRALTVAPVFHQEFSNGLRCLLAVMCFEQGSLHVARHTC